jgi:hypothetical protein
MTVDFMYSICLYAVAKNKQQGYLSPDDFNNVINQGQYGYLDYLLGEFQQYTTGRPIARVQFGMSEQVRQSLTAFIQRPVPLTVDVTGLSAYPTDFEQVDAMYTTAMDRIRYVAQHKLPATLKSVIDPVATNPIYLIVDQGFQFYPLSLGSALLSYVKTPPDIKWAFVPDVNGLPVYDPANSADPLWYNVDCFQVMVRALALVGVNLQVPQLEQYSNIIKTQGQ